MAEADRGLVLVSGVSGSGKSSTVAAMVHHINRTLHKHVVTIENPIEFLHRDLQLLHHPAGSRAWTPKAWPSASRPRCGRIPDVVVLGEMADAATIDTALKGAETGHLVIATITTPDVVTTIERRDCHPAGRRAGDRPDAVLRGGALDRVPAAASAEGRQGQGRRGRGPARYAGGARVPQGPRGEPLRSSDSWRTATRSLAPRPTSSTSMS